MTRRSNKFGYSNNNKKCSTRKTVQPWCVQPPEERAAPQQTKVENVAKTANSTGDINIKNLETPENVEQPENVKSSENPKNLPKTNIKKNKPILDFLTHKHQLQFSCWQVILMFLIVITVLTIQSITFPPENTNKTSQISMIKINEFQAHIDSRYDSASIYPSEDFTYMYGAFKNCGRAPKFGHF